MNARMIMIRGTADYDRGDGVDREEHRRRGPRVLHVVVVRVARHLRHPRRIGAGTEDLARAAEHDHAQRGVLVRRFRPRRQVGNYSFVEGVAHIGPVQRDAFNSAVPLDCKELVAHWNC